MLFVVDAASGRFPGVAFFFWLDPVPERGVAASFRLNERRPTTRVLR
jgi:hypothetical protein